MTILTPDQRLRVFVSSTLQELLEERKAAKAAIEALRLSPVMFELGARPHPPRDLYRAYLEQSHLFVGIYWQRYGWVAPGESISGLEDEYHLSGNRPKLIYVKAPAPEREERLKDLLKHIQQDDQASYKPFGTAKELRKLLEDDLALLLTERFAASLPPAAPSTAAAAATPPRPALPLAPTPLVGREWELAEVGALLLGEEVRLVTLLGPGGVGKSRLALELATRLQAQASFPDGVVYVPLAHLSDPTLVLPAVAAALGLREDGGGSLLERLIDRLRGKRILLVLDNFEQLEAGAPVLSELLGAVPGVELLVTSRAALRLAAEHLYEVPPLSLPSTSVSPLEALRAAEAVRLFEARAKAVKPGFALTVDNALAVAEICHRLDGLPLAIELAAARSNLLPPQALLKRLDKRFELLSGGARDLPARQQTLRNAIDWSYALLGENHRVLFSQLGVFVGGFTLEAAEAICEEGLDVLSGLTALVENSLVRQSEVDGEARFGLLETLREYALEKLRERGTAETVRARHAHFFLKLATAAETHFTDDEQGRWLDRLDLEHSNLRAALEGSAAAEAGDLGLSLAGSLWRFWYARGHLSEGRRWLTRLLDTAAHTPAPHDPLARAKACHGAGVLADAQGDYAQAKALLEAALLLRRDAQDSEGIAATLNSLGLVLLEQAEYGQAKALLEESLELRRDHEDRWGVAATLNNLGKAAYDQGDWATALPLFEESLGLFRSFQDRARVAALLGNMGSSVQAQGDLARARALHTEALALWRELDDDWGIALALYNLADAALGQRDRAEALHLYRESLRSFWQMEDKKSTTECLEKLALLCTPERAARLLGVAAAQREALGSPLPQRERGAFAEAVGSLKTALGAVRFDDLWAEGRTLSLADAVTLALEEEG